MLRYLALALYALLGIAPGAEGLLIHTVKESSYPAVAPLAGPIEQGKPMLQPETGLTFRRITDLADYTRMHSHGPRDAPTEAWESYKQIDWAVGNPELGNTNGYAKYCALNVTGEYLMVHMPNSLIGLYRVADAKYLGAIPVTADRGVAENPNDIRWDISGKPGTETRLYYVWGDTIYQQDAIKGFTSRVALDKPGVEGLGLLYSGGEGDFDGTGRYFALKFGRYDETVKYNVDVSCGVYDFEEMKLLPAVVRENPNGLDMSPSGKWMAWLGHEGPTGKANRFYRVSDMQTSATLNWVSVDSAEKWNSVLNTVGQSIGHNGWAYDHAGNEVLIYQDNNDDWMKAFDPEKGKSFKIYNMGSWGWGDGFHAAAIKNPALKGWFLYASCDAKSAQDDKHLWHENQLMMIEVKPYDEADPPRVWRLASTQNVLRSYPSEAWAAIDHSGRHVVWASNQGATTNLETFILDLPENWPETLNGAGK